MLASDSGRSWRDELSSGVKRFHAGRALADVEIEGALAELLGEDQIGNLGSLLSVLQLVLQEDQQQRERRQPLLAVDDELHAVLVADDDRPEEVVAVVGHIGALVARLVALQELGRQVSHQLSDLLRLPLVLALVVVDGVLPASQQFADSPSLAIDLAWQTPVKRHRSSLHRLQSVSPAIAIPAPQIPARRAHRLRTELPLI